MIDEHIISVESNYKSFNATCGFITKNMFFKRRSINELKYLKIMI